MKVGYAIAIQQVASADLFYNECFYFDVIRPILLLAKYGAGLLAHT